MAEAGREGQAWWATASTTRRPWRRPTSALPSTGADVAKKTGDVVLVKSSLMDVIRHPPWPQNIRTIKINFFWALFYNILMIPVAAGLLYPVNGLVLKPEWACIAMWFSSITVVTELTAAEAF